MLACVLKERPRANRNVSVKSRRGKRGRKRNKRGLGRKKSKHRRPLSEQDGVMSRRTAVEYVPLSPRCPTTTEHLHPEFQPPDALRGADVDRHTHLGLSSLSLVLSRATRRNTTQRETPGGLCICKEGCLLLAVCQSSC